MVFLCWKPGRRWTPHAPESPCGEGEAGFTLNAAARSPRPPAWCWRTPRLELGSTQEQAPQRKAEAGEEGEPLCSHRGPVACRGDRGSLPRGHSLKDPVQTHLTGDTVGRVKNGLTLPGDRWDPEREPTCPRLACRAMVINSRLRKLDCCLRG